MQPRSGFERALPRLCRCRLEAEVFQQARHIVVAVETDDLPLLELQDITALHFDAREPARDAD
jgi:hypothetical protein